jgi:uncharacterized peroxidase-related enzyme
MKAPTYLLTPLTAETAPEKSRPYLEQVQKSFQFIPNLFGLFANSPALIEGYLALDKSFEKTSLSPIERQVVLLAVSVENACAYCTAAHSTALKTFLKAPPDVVSAVRSRMTISNPKLDALATLAREIVVGRGHVSPEVIEQFLAAGYRKEQVLEIMIGVALKTISNYTHNISPVDLDTAFQSEA